MKITKTFVSVFLATFLIGYASVLPIKKVPAPEKLEKANFQTKFENAFTQDFPKPKAELTFKPEIFNLKDDREEDDFKFKIDLIDMIEGGEGYRTDKSLAKSGETWLGLFEVNGKHRLDNKKINVRSERTKYGFDETVGVIDKTKPIFLLKNAGKLREGEVETLFSRPSDDEAERLGIELKPMQIGFSREFRLGDRIYTLEVKAGLSESNEKRSVLVLKSENKSQIVYFNLYFEAGDNIGELIWVGDLDRDGKLDLYMNEYGFEKGGFGSILFLSSEAEKGKLVKAVAAFGTLGC